MSLRKDDLVFVTTGKNAGKTGKILKFLQDHQKVLVEKINLVKRHVKPTKDNPQGGIIEKEASVHISNVLYYCPKCSKGVRLGSKEVGGKKVRVCAKCDQVVDKN